MKNFKLLAFTTSLAFASFGAIVFTSCNKQNCSMVTCQNGGTCSDGKCSCPAGYSGILCEVKARTAIRYKNNTYTPISITINGDGQTIPVGGSVVFPGVMGTTAFGTAATAGSANQLGISDPGGIIGLTMNWSLDHTFPTTDTMTVPLDVGSTFFFLKMSNSRSADIINYYVNYQFSYGQAYQDITVPHDGQTHNMGYYLAYPASNVMMQTSDSKVEWRAVTLPSTSNQSFTASF